MYEMANFSIKHVKKKENLNFNFKFIPSSYIKNLLGIVVKLKIKKCWPYHEDTDQTPFQAIKSS